MCGRYSLGASHAEVQALHGYNVQVGEWIGQEEFIPRHNIAPRSQAPVLRRREPAADGTHNSNELILQTMKWGLVPHWSKHEDKTLNTTNARSENLVEGGGMWASIKTRKRCAVICEGYFEWLKKGKERLPHFTKLGDGKLMLLAGLYDSVILEGETKPLWTFTIVTTDANKNFTWLHDRQPVILSSMDALNTWLDTSSQKWSHQLTKVLEPYHDESPPLVCYQVPKEVGKVGTESPTFIEPIAERKDGIQAMFAKQKAASSSKPSPTTFKRKRSSSPQILSGSKEDAHKESTVPKRSKAEKVNAWEDDSDIEYIDEPSTSTVKPLPNRKARQENQSEPSSSQDSPTKPPGTGKSRKPTKHQKGDSVSSSEITAFFSKS